MVVVICEAQATCVARSNEKIRRIEQADQDGGPAGLGGGPQDSLGVDGIWLVFSRRIRIGRRREMVRVVSGASVMMSQRCRRDESAEESRRCRDS